MKDHVPPAQGTPWNIGIMHRVKDISAFIIRPSAKGQPIGCNTLQTTAVNNGIPL